MNESQEQGEAPPLPRKEEDFEEEIEEIEEIILNKIKHPSDRQFFIMAGLAILGLAAAVGSPFVPDLWKAWQLKRVAAKTTQLAQAAVQDIPAGYTMVPTGEYERLQGRDRMLDHVTAQLQTVIHLLMQTPVGGEINANDHTNSPLWKRIR